MNLRDYQYSIYTQLTATQDDAVFQLETGGGKTAIIAKLNDRPTINIAHRNILIEKDPEHFSKMKQTFEFLGVI